MMSARVKTFTTVLTVTRPVSHGHFHYVTPAITITPLQHGGMIFITALDIFGRHITLKGPLLITLSIIQLVDIAFTFGHMVHGLSKQISIFLSLRMPP
ncbi:MAG: hypothetical protein ACP5HC_09385 [Caldisericum sp.]